MAGGRNQQNAYSLCYSYAGNKQAGNNEAGNNDAGNNGAGNNEAGNKGLGCGKSLQLLNESCAGRVICVLGQDTGGP